MADLVLSSGFLAFARHVGFLEAIDASGLPVDAVVGTSSGAVVGALWAAGASLDVVREQIARQRTIDLFQFHRKPWRGLFSLTKLIAQLERFLPATFADLSRPFAVGVSGPSGHRLLTEGPLAPAVAASCAMPGIFGPVTIGGVPYRDGGAIDRLGIGAWRKWRGVRRAVVHHVERTAGVDVTADLDGLVVVRTPRSRASFFSLGDFAAQAAEARRITERALADPGHD